MELEFTMRPVAVKAHLLSYHRRQEEDIKCVGRVKLPDSMFYEAQLRTSQQEQSYDCCHIVTTKRPRWRNRTTTNETISLLEE